MEILGEQPDQVLSSLHFGSSFPKRELMTHTLPIPGVGDAPGSVADWHVYAVAWEPGVMRWSFDGVVWATQDFWWSSSKHAADGQGLEAESAADLNPWPAPFDQPFYLVMNVAVGGNCPGAPNPQLGRAHQRQRLPLRDGLAAGVRHRQHRDADGRVLRR